MGHKTRMKKKSCIEEARLVLDQIHGQDHLQAWEKEQWLSSLTLMDALHQRWYTEKMKGWDSQDLGIIACYEAKVFHPFSDAPTLARQKVCQELPKALTSEDIRLEHLRPILRQQHQEWIEHHHTRSRPDLLQQIQTYAQNMSPNGWRCDIDDVIETHEGLMLVYFQAPGPTRFEHIKETGVGYHDAAAVQAGLYWARQAGVEATQARWFVFDSDAWSTHAIDIGLDPVLQERVPYWLETGKQWREKGVIPEPLMLSNSSSLEKLQKGQGMPHLVDQISALTDQVFALGVLEKECERQKKLLIQKANDMLPVVDLPNDMKRLDTGPTRVKIDRVYHMDKVAETARGLLAMNGQSEADIQRTLEGENFYQRPDWNLEKVRNALKETYGIDVDRDPKLQAFRGAHHYREETLIQFVRDLAEATQQPIEWSELLDENQSKVTIEMIRAPAAGPLKAARELMEAEIRKHMPAVLESSSRHYKEGVKQAQAMTKEAEPAPPKKPRKKS